VAPAGTVARSSRRESTRKAVAAVPLNDTDLVPRRWSPDTSTSVPTGPDAGDRPEITTRPVACAGATPSAERLPVRRSNRGAMPAIFRATEGLLVRADAPKNNADPIRPRPKGLVRSVLHPWIRFTARCTTRARSRRIEAGSARRTHGQPACGTATRAVK